jgi:hypothetical protein
MSQLGRGAKLIGQQGDRGPELLSIILLATAARKMDPVIDDARSANPPSTRRCLRPQIRNPCYDVGDVRVLAVVDAPACRHLVDVLVLPVTGPRPTADEASGGAPPGTETRHQATCLCVGSQHIVEGGLYSRAQELLSTIGLVRKRMQCPGVWSRRY